MKCKICGKEEDVSHWSNQSEMEKHQMCFSCNFWRDMLEQDAKCDPHTVCMIDGTHYVIEPDEPNAAFQGFGGAEFQIEFNDGHKVITHHLLSSQLLFTLFHLRSIWLSIISHNLILH
ncbi:MAG: hypothetical protein K6D37_03635 [Prevotella sp.]|nr:hypothetical protein [Prevotella sp.]